MLSKFFINRPIFASVLSIVLVLAGLIAIKGLPIQEYPSIVPPQISIQAVYPGADAETLSKTVASPLEDAINGAKNMIYMTSTASPSGILRMTVTFATGTKPADANVDVNNRVQVALNKLPEAVRRQGVSIRERSPDMLRVISFTSEGQKHNSLWLNNYAMINVLDDIKRINGVGDAFLFGSKEYAIRVWIRPDELSAYDLTVNDIIRVISSQNAQIGTGQIGDEPTASKQVYTYTVLTEGRLKTAEEFGNIIVRSNPDGSSLRLKDIAGVELGSERYMLNALYNKQEMAVAGIFLAPGANALEVSDALDRTLEEAAKEYPEDVREHTLYDTTKFVKASIREVLKTLAEAILLVVVIIYFFLGNVRATIIPVLAIPVSLLGAFAGLPGRRRRHRRHRERREDPARQRGYQRQRGDDRSDARDHRTGHRDRPGALRRLHPDRPCRRLQRPDVPAVRHHHRHLRRHLGYRGPDPDAGTLRRLPARARERALLACPQVPPLFRLPDPGLCRGRQKGAQVCPAQHRVLRSDECRRDLCRAEAAEQPGAGRGQGGADGPLLPDAGCFA